MSSRADALNSGKDHTADVFNSRYINHTADVFNSGYIKLRISLIANIPHCGCF